MDVEDKSRVMNCCGERTDSQLKANWCNRQSQKKKIVIDNSVRVTYGYRVQFIHLTMSVP